jgi:hypothetical protein
MAIDSIGASLHAVLARLARLGEITADLTPRY